MSEPIPQEWAKAFATAYNEMALRLRPHLECLHAGLFAVIPLIRADEREACAKVAEKTPIRQMEFGETIMHRSAIASAIRARGEKT